MRPSISIWGFVCPLVGRLVGPSVGPSGTHSLHWQKFSVLLISSVRYYSMMIHQTTATTTTTKIMMTMTTTTTATTTTKHQRKGDASLFDRTCLVLVPFCIKELKTSPELYIFLCIYANWACHAGKNWKELRKTNSRLWFFEIFQQCSKL